MQAPSAPKLCLPFEVTLHRPHVLHENSVEDTNRMDCAGLPRKRQRLSAGLNPSETMEEGYTNGRSHAQFVQGMLQNGNRDDTLSRATSPGLGFSSNGVDLETEKRYRPRTFPYFQLLPYNVEEEAERNAALKEILKQLYIAIKAEDITPGAVHWTRELKAWLNLKFEITRELRVKLVKLYYMLTFAPGMDYFAAERFESMLRFLLK